MGEVIQFRPLIVHGREDGRLIGFYLCVDTYAHAFPVVVLGPGSYRMDAALPLCGAIRIPVMNAVPDNEACAECKRVFHRWLKKAEMA